MKIDAILDTNIGSIFDEYIGLDKNYTRNKPKYAKIKTYDEYKTSDPVSGEVLYMLALPYIKKEDIRCSVSSGILTIETNGKMTKSDNPFIVYGKHTIEVNKPASDIKLSFIDGVLKIRIKCAVEQHGVELPIE